MAFTHAELRTHPGESAGIPERRKAAHATRHRKDHMQRYGAVVWPTPEQQPQYDLAFMGRMLGITGLCASLPPPVPNRAAIEFAMADPIANARAQQRIGDLLMQCERTEWIAEEPSPPWAGREHPFAMPRAN